LELGSDDRARSSSDSSRFGTSLGYILPAVATFHALHFHWADGLKNALVTSVG
jgi:hypothetical protein